MSDKYRMDNSIVRLWGLRILGLLITFHLSLIISPAQQIKPCGTSILARRHVIDRDASSKARHRKAPRKDAYIGEKRGLVIMVSFPDIPFQDETSSQLWNDIINQEGYADNGAQGSVSDYFFDQSYGQFQLKFDVLGPIEAAHDHAYYGQNKDWGDITAWFDQNVGELVEEACRAVADQVQFSDYDWDGDGEVDQVFLLYAGHGENDYWSKDSTVIWPHMATLSGDWEGYENGLELQGVRINTYACSNEITRSNELAGMGIFCHEFSHCFGLPDMYNTEMGNSVLGSYDLMDIGCYNGNSWCPVGYSSYERYACGWLTPFEIENPHAVIGIDPDNEITRASSLQSIRPLIRYPHAGIYRNSPEANDYFLIENRLKESWDTYIPQTGLMAWHIDYDERAWYENTVNNDPNHLRVELMDLLDIPSGITSITSSERTTEAIYDLQGRRLSTSTLPAGHIYIVKNSDGSVRKHVTICR